MEAAGGAGARLEGGSVDAPVAEPARAVAVAVCVARGADNQYPASSSSSSSSSSAALRGSPRSLAASLSVAGRRAARQASREVGAASLAQRNEVLGRMREGLAAARATVLAANEADLSAASVDGVAEPLVKRLGLAGKYDTLLSGLEDVARLEDPVGAVSLARRLADGLDLFRVSAPIGVLLIIFEARPDAAVQIASLAVKSGNAVILKGGREAARSNAALVAVMQDALEASHLPRAAIQLVESREDVKGLLGLDSFIDLVIPRGSSELVRYIQANTSIPVLGHADGICSVYVHADADPAMAARVVVDAKTTAPSACNSAETLLVHVDARERVLRPVGEALARAGVRLRADERALPFLDPATTTPATAADFRTEFLDLEMAVKTVDSLEEAIRHINAHGSHHTDAILCEDPAAAEAFFVGVDSAGVFHNASTRFADGFRFGFGAEVGISTHKLPPRGPVGLEGLVTYRYRLYGGGHAAGEFGVGPGLRPYLHTPLPAALPGAGGR